MCWNYKPRGTSGSGTGRQTDGWHVPSQVLPLTAAPSAPHQVTSHASHPPVLGNQVRGQFPARAHTRTDTHACMHTHSHVRAHTRTHARMHEHTCAPSVSGEHRALTRLWRESILFLFLRAAAPVSSHRRCGNPWPPWRCQLLIPASLLCVATPVFNRFPPFLVGPSTFPHVHWPFGLYGFCFYYF